MQHVQAESTYRCKLRWTLGGLALLGLLLIGQGIAPAGAHVDVPATGTATVDLTPTATPTPDTAATTVGSTATAVSRTATAISSTATALAAQGTIVSIGATQTALAATITALAGTPLLTHTPQPTATPTAMPLPCLDSYEPDSDPAAARPLVVGEQQTHLLCPAGDADWVTFFAKAGKAYQIETIHLSTGADTYLYLFAPDSRTVVAENDDTPGEPGPSRLVWVPPADGWCFLQIKNQGDIGTPGLAYTLNLSFADDPTAPPDPRGKTYSLLVQIDPPTPTPSSTPRPSPTDPRAPPAPAGGVGDGSGFSSGPVGTPAPVLPAPVPPTIPSPLGSMPLLPTPSMAPATSVGPSHSPTSAASPTTPATPTATPVTVQVDVVAYVAPTGDQDPQRGPQPDDGIEEGVAVLLIDGPTNAVLQTALTGRNGHAALRWVWSGWVRIALPAFRWGRALAWEDVQRESQGAGRLYLEARTPGYALPGIFP